MICMVSLIFHLNFRPFIPVCPGRDTLFWAEFWALFVGFLTFWTGLFFFQAEKPWWSDRISTGFAVELITVNVLYMILSMRWYMILKLMDTADLIMTKELQGADEKELKGAKSTRYFLQRFVPEWKAVQNLWAKKAWQSTIRHQVMANRSLRALGAFGSTANDASGAAHPLKRHKSYKTAAQRRQSDDALASLGLGAHREAEVAERKKRDKAALRKRRKVKREKSLAKFKGHFTLGGAATGATKQEKAAVKEGKKEREKSAMEVMQDAADARKREKSRKVAVEQKMEHEREDLVRRKHARELEVAHKLIDAEEDLARKEKKTAVQPKKSNLPAFQTASPIDPEIKLQQLMAKEKQQEQEMTNLMNKSMTDQHDRLAQRIQRKKSQHSIKQMEEKTKQKATKDEGEKLELAKKEKAPGRRKPRKRELTAVVSM